MLGQLTTLIYNIADTYFVSLTNDPDQIAAVTLCAPVLLIIMSIGTIFGAGGSSLVARMLGGKQEDEAGKVISYCIYTTVIVSLASMVLLFIFLSPLVKLIGADADNASFTSDYLRYVLFGLPFVMFGNAMIHIFRSVGLIKLNLSGGTAYADYGAGDRADFLYDLIVPLLEISEISCDAAGLKYLGENSSAYADIFDNAVFPITEEDKTRLITSIRKLKEGKDLEDTLDIDQVLRYFAVHSFTMNYDSLASIFAHNYYLYEENNERREPKDKDFLDVLEFHCDFCKAQTPLFLQEMRQQNHDTENRSKCGRKCSTRNSHIQRIHKNII